jgi:hypothetical protein
MMLEQIKQVLAREGITAVAIIDDVYDETPALVDIQEAEWNVFADDIDEAGELIIKDELNEPDVHEALPKLTKDPSFVRFVWERRERSPVFGRLFEPYAQRRDGGRRLLEPLRLLLTNDLGLVVTTTGSRRLEGEGANVGDDAQLVFLDLFLGAAQDAAALKRARERIDLLRESRRANPPLVVLMSSSARLESLRDSFRDEGKFLGCQFRTLSKGDIEDKERIHELLYRLASRYRDTLKLAAFVYSWHAALADAAERFLQKIRRLDLRDYADIQELVLASQDERVGTYLLEAYDQFFHYELESDLSLTDAASKMDEISWSDYPPPHFLPEAVAGEIVDGLLFHHQASIAVAEPIQFGDVLFAMREDEHPAGREPKVDFAKGERLALLVLTQACDLQQGNAKTVLFLAGVARPAELVFDTRPDALRTPSLIAEARRYLVEWEVGAPMSWTPEELKRRLAADSFRRMRRFRTLHALQLQQLFAGKLSRVGTPVMPPPRHGAGVDISYVNKEGRAVSLLVVPTEKRQAVVLVGRDKKKHTDHLVLSSELVDELRGAMRRVAVDRLSEKDRAKWSTVLADREFFASLEQRVPYDRNASKRPFAGKPAVDILQVVGPYVDPQNKPVKADGSADRNAGPLIVDIKVSVAAQNVGEGE